MKALWQVAIATAVMLGGFGIIALISLIFDRKDEHEREESTTPPQ